MYLHMYMAAPMKFLVHQSSHNRYTVKSTYTKLTTVIGKSPFDDRRISLITPYHKYYTPNLTFIWYYFLDGPQKHIITRIIDAKYTILPTESIYPDDNK